MQISAEELERHRAIVREQCTADDYAALGLEHGCEFACECIDACAGKSEDEATKWKDWHMTRVRHLTDMFREKNGATDEMCARYVDEVRIAMLGVIADVTRDHDRWVLDKLLDGA